MKDSFSILFFTRKSRSKTESLSSIFLRITADSKRVEISLQRKIKTSDWNSTTGKVKGTTREALEINKHLDAGMENHRLMRVIYSQNPNKVSEKMPFANSYQLGIKLKHWSYENEWRLVVDKTDNNFRKLRYPKDNIMEFIFGYRFFELTDKKEVELRNEFLQIIKENFPNVPKYTLGPDFDSFNLKKMRLFDAEDIYDFK